MPAAYSAAKNSAAVFNLAGWTSMTLTGWDAAKFLHNFCTSDITKLPASRAVETFLTNVKARVVGHAFAIRPPDVYPEEELSEEDREDPAFQPKLFLFGAPGQGKTLAAHLDRYLIREQVTIEDETAYEGGCYVCGPEAATRIEAAAQRPGTGFRGGLESPTALAPFGATWAVFEQAPALICRLDLFGVPGFLILHDRRALPHVGGRLISDGSVAGTLEAFNSLRIEAAFPLYDTDITEDHLAPEVGRPWAISYTKGCYLGQEPIARIDALGHVNRLLCGLRLDAVPVPDRGAAVLADGKEIGAVTSATTSLADGNPVALAYLRTKFADPDTRVAVRTATGEIPATVYRATPPA